MKKQMRHRIVFSYGILLWVLIFGGISAEARRLSGMQGGREVTFETVLLPTGEYVNAKRLLPYFTNAYQYDALAGVMHFYRADGIMIGVMAGDNRVIVNRTIHHTRDRTLRREGTIYLSLEVVDTFLFPRVQFTTASSPPDEGGDEASTQRFTYASPTPVREEENPFGIFPTSTPLPGMPDVEVPASPVSLIVLDPGNDPKNPGAGVALSAFEEDLTLLICEKLKRALEETPAFQVVLTRRRGENATVTNVQRVGIANAHNAAVFISIHCGGFFTPSHSRAAVFFMNAMLDRDITEMQDRVSHLNIPWQKAYQPHQNESYDLAKTLIEELNPFFQLAGIIQLDENPRPGRLSVLRGLTMPGVLVELGNLNHSATARYLLNDRIMDELVFEIEQAVSNYLYSRVGIQRTGQSP